MPQPSDSRKFDVIVVGSGASGGWAAKRLSEAGVRVALVDCGKPHGDADFTEHKPAWELKYRDRADELMRKTRPVQKDCYACMEYNQHWFANDLEEPYTTPEDKPFSWQGRLRVIGGRTNVWGRQSYRLSDLDFKARSHDGYGEDWPLSYADLAPYYDIVERYVGISGDAEGVDELPDGQFLPGMPMTCGETRLKTRVKAKLGYTVTIGRTANLTKPINGRAACHYCGPCERGCTTHSYFNSAFTTVADALKSGHCTLIPNAMVWKVLTDPKTNKATGVMYVDRNTHDVQEIHARVVVLCAQALESTRILLNSSTRDAANGLANSSGALGHYLMDHHSVAGAFGAFFDMPKEPAREGGPSRPNGIYVIRFRNTLTSPQQKDFIRGYGFQGGGGSRFNYDAPGYGAAYKKGLMTASAGRRVPRRIRRDARAFRQLRRDRSEGHRRQVRDPCPEDQHEVRRQRVRHDEGHGDDGRRDAACGGRRLRAGIQPAQSRAGVGHSRSRHRAHGQRSEDVGAEPVLSHARHREPLRHGRLVLRLDRLPEPDAHHHGHHGAVDGPAHGRNEKGKRLGNEE